MMSPYEEMYETVTRQGKLIDELKFALSIAIVGGDYLPSELRQFKKLLKGYPNSTKGTDDVKKLIL